MRWEESPTVYSLYEERATTQRGSIHCVQLVWKLACAPKKGRRKKAPRISLKSLQPFAARRARVPRVAPPAAPLPASDPAPKLLLPVEPALPVAPVELLPVAPVEPPPVALVELPPVAPDELPARDDPDMPAPADPDVLLSPDVVL